MNIGGRCPNCHGAYGQDHKCPRIVSGAEYWEHRAHANAAEVSYLRGNLSIVLIAARRLVDSAQDTNARGISVVGSGELFDLSNALDEIQTRGRTI